LVFLKIKQASYIFKKITHIFSIKTVTHIESTQLIWRKMSRPCTRAAKISRKWYCNQFG